MATEAETTAAGTATVVVVWVRFDEEKNTNKPDLFR
jgi:hypothetical protein